MPKPVYMLCSESIAVDAQSGLVSHFNVLDSIELHQRRLPRKSGSAPIVLPVDTLKFVIVAIWAKENRDSSETEFEVEIGLTRPEKKSEDIVYKSTFTFSKQRQRFQVHAILGPHPNSEDGVIETECRVRKPGSKTWIRQSYHFHQTVVKAPAVDDPHAGNGKKPRGKKK